MFASAVRSAVSRRLARAVWFVQHRRLRKYIRGGLRVGRDVSIQPGVDVDGSPYRHILPQVTPAMRREMNDKIADRPAHVV